MLANTRRLTSGCGVRISHHKKAPAPITAITNSVMMIEEYQPSRWPLESPINKHVSGAAISMKPTQSNGGRGPSLSRSGKNTLPQKMAVIHTGIAT